MARSCDLYDLYDLYDLPTCCFFTLLSKFYLIDYWFIEHNFKLNTLRPRPPWPYLLDPVASSHTRFSGSRFRLARLKS